MSLTKRRLEQELERGFAATGMLVCGDCIGDPALAALVQAIAEGGACSYCEGRPAADLDDVLEHMLTALRFEYRPASEESLPWDNEEKRYMANELWLPDLVFEHFDDDIGSEALREEIIETLAGAEPWFERDAYALRPHEQMLVSWQRFARVASHRRDGDMRPVSRRPRDFDASISTSRLLDAIGEQITELPDAFRLLPPGTPIWRARPSDSAGYATAADLGAPPEGFPVSAGRMNRAGQIRFYGALDPITALLERFRGNPSHLSLGRFTALRPMWVLDLTARRLALPSIWDLERQQQRVTMRFLADFAHQISLPVLRVASPRYIPTQLVTDYVEGELAAMTQMPIVGMLFPSSRAPGINVVFFFGARASITQGEAISRKSRLELDPRAVRVISRRRLRKLARRWS